MRPFKNIIFDFGGVILTIDYLKTIASFQKLGIPDFEEQYSKMKQSNLFDEFETGKISSAEFRDRIRSISSLPLSDRQINYAWNSILIDFPKENLEILERLKKSYRIFLLSNTNEIHEHAFKALIQKKFGRNVLNETFEHVYLSHHLHLRKPDPAIYNFVLKENNLEAGETLFVDDSIQHIEGAAKVGLQTFYFEKGKRLSDIVDLQTI
jgi:HAD superfamily hydrolase (TIGR01509 family)